ncbi:MAG: hypothetical protein ACFB10_26715 [Salibacteraceae bacterium]
MASIKGAPYPRLILMNDSQMGINHQIIEWEELEKQLAIVKWDDPENKALFIEVVGGFHFGKLSSLEERFAKASIDTLQYRFEHKRIRKHLVSAGKKNLSIRLTRKNTLFWDTMAVADDAWLQDKIEEERENTGTNTLYFLVENGVGYEHYIDQKLRLEELLHSIDSSIVLTEDAPHDYYKEVAL